MQNSIVRLLRIFAATLDKLENISWFLIFALQYLPRNTAKIRRRQNFPFYGTLLTVPDTHS